jgi:AcrR family transcriptional regulator
VDDQIVTGARRALQRYGLAGATLERIATEAGVSRMTLHRRGIGRDKLLRALVDRMVEAERAALWPALTAVGDAATRLQLALEAECSVAEDHLEVLEAMDAGERDEIFHGDDGLTRAEFVEPLRRLLIDGVQDGTLRSADPDEDATVLFNVVGRTYRHLRTGHGWEPARARDAVVRLALDGVRAR